MFTIEPTNIKDIANELSYKAYVLQQTITNSFTIYKLSYTFLVIKNVSMCLLLCYT